MLSKDESRAAAERLVQSAMRAGADSADVLYAGSRSTDVQVRLGKLDHVGRSESEEIGLRVFLGARSASVALPGRYGTLTPRSTPTTEASSKARRAGAIVANRFMKRRNSSRSPASGSRLSSAID